MNLTHHAYYIEDSPSTFDLYRGSLPLSQGIAPHDPGLYARAYEKFGIDEARELKQLASLRSESGTSLFLLAVSSITTEAQQALLKLFEEPRAGIVFVVIVPPGTLIPTLKSRMLPHERLARVHALAEAKKFLSAAPKGRSDLLAKLLKDEELVKDRVRDFLDSIELVLLPRIAEPAVRAGLEDVARVRSYVGDRSPSLKMLLEHLALSLPTL